MFVEFKADISNLNEILSYIEAKADNILFSKNKKFYLRLISEEILVNIINYSYPEGNGKIFVNCRVDNSKLIVTIKDNGKKFNPLTHKPPEFKNDLEKKEIGGLGIFLAIKKSDFIEYNYKNNENILTFILEEDDK